VSVVLSDSAREFTGATGLEPATSGVIGRSRPHQADQELPGICSMSRAFLRTACGDYPGSAGASGDLVRDVRGMGSRPARRLSGTVGWPAP
jgi:hypothetical protein